MWDITWDVMGHEVGCHVGHDVECHVFCWVKKIFKFAGENIQISPWVMWDMEWDVILDMRWDIMGHEVGCHVGHDTGCHVGHDTGCHVFAG